MCAHRFAARPRYAHKSVFDFHGSRLFSDAATLASEDVIMAARNDDGGPAMRDAVALDSLADYKHRGSFELHNDQRAAAAQVLLSGNRLDAIVGPGAR